MHNDKINWLPAEWPAAEHVHAGTTTRKGGFSRGVFASFNLADHVGDEANAVRQNRQLLRHAFALADDPAWLDQVHGNTVINLPADRASRTADGSYCNLPGQVCTVLTADCLPLLLCNQQGTEIAAVHIGWRSFCTNIISRALEKFASQKHEILAWMGPSICARHYETGEEVRTACLELISDAGIAFEPTRPGHWLTSLQKLVRLQLNQSGVDKIYGATHCTFSDIENFYSYRREGNTGRCASLIWMDC